MTDLFSSPAFQIGALLFALVFMFLFGRASARGGAPRPPVDATAAFTGLSADTQTEVDALVRQKKMIDAIRVVRTQSGLDLKDSKAVVDARARAIGA